MGGHIDCPPIHTDDCSKNFCPKKGARFLNHCSGHVPWRFHTTSTRFTCFRPRSSSGALPLCRQPHQLCGYSCLRTIMAASGMQIMHICLRMLKQNQTSVVHSACFYRQARPLLGPHCLRSLTNLPYWAYNAASSWKFL